MDRLTEQAYWDDVYAGTDALSDPLAPAAPKTGLKGFLQRRLGRYWRDYADFLEWDVLYDRHLPRGTGLKVVEVGSAPGVNLVRLLAAFGYEPYGVEYSKAGAARNRRVFERHGIDPGRVIEADLFSADFLTEHAGSFDVVVSRGFIEHFTDVEDVVDAHVRLLKPGGTLVVTIPKLTGVPRLLFRCFNPKLIALHNLEIMRRDRFAALFARPDLTAKHCDYFGTFRVQVCGVARSSGVRRAAMNVLMTGQLALNLAFRAVFGRRGAESHAFSPYLIYVGTKTR